MQVVSIRVGRRKLGSDPDFLNLPGRQAQRLHVEDPFLPRNLNCVLSTDKEEFGGGGGDGLGGWWFHPKQP